MTLQKGDYLNLRVVSVGTGITSSQANQIIENVCSTVNSDCLGRFAVTEVNLDAQPDDSLNLRLKSPSTLNVQMF